MILDQVPEVQAAGLTNPTKIDIETDDGAKMERKLPGIKVTTISPHSSANWCRKKDQIFKAFGFGFLGERYTEFGATIFSQRGSRPIFTRGN